MEEMVKLHVWYSFSSGLTSGMFDLPKSEAEEAFKIFIENKDTKCFVSKDKKIAISLQNTIGVKIEKLRKSMKTNEEISDRDEEIKQMDYEIKKLHLEMEKIHLEMNQINLEKMKNPYGTQE